MLVGCPTVHGDCIEDPQADAPAQRRIELTLAGEMFEVEVADTAQARRRPWADRRCDLEGILLVPDAPGPYPLQLCDLQTEVDLAFIRAAQVAAAVEFAPPCPGPCADCPVYGETLTDVEAVLIALPDLSEFHTGDAVLGLDAL
jgi:uncharacterized membrane protein (UPF0127 family)